MPRVPTGGSTGATPCCRWTQAVAVQTGDRVDVDVRLLDVTGELAWTIRVTRPATGAVIVDERHSTFEGRLDLGDALAIVGSGAPPRLSRSGMVERMILDLCDGQRSTADIVEAVRRAHPDRFTTDAEARTRVHAVLLHATETGDSPT